MEVSEEPVASSSWCHEYADQPLNFISEEFYLWNANSKQ
jgi:hypothetical protein